MTNGKRRPGLILLVVLGMLALFSLLAVTYVVFASQSRAASMALARSEIRGHKTRKPLMEEAIKALIRGPQFGGPTDFVPMSGHDLLGDLYGTLEAPREIGVRNIRVTGGRMSFDRSCWERPMILNGHFLRIPVESTSLPAESDLLNGRVITFMENSGPLSGQSFHIVRYIGAVNPSAGNPVDQQLMVAQSYSITIDLNEADLNASYTRVVSGTPTTQSLAEWVAAFPSGSPWAPGVFACYGVVDTTTTALGAGYRLLLNAAPLNNHGMGILNDGSSQLHYFDANSGSLAGTEINEMATALQPNYAGLIQPSGLVGGKNGVLTHASPVNAGAANYGNYDNQGVLVTLGDSDEPYDAADYQNMFLSYTYSGATNSLGVIPSFHRAALINYIVNWKNPANWTEEEFKATLRRIELAAIRPLSINVRIGGFAYVRNPEFTGSNTGSLVGTPTLNMQLTGWGQWQAVGWPVFQTWLNGLTQGPWDVDNNSDGIMDSVFVDAGLPLETSADGKLLKALVAYYVEDLDSKLDINATSNLAQASVGVNQAGQTVRNPYVYSANDQYAKFLNNPSFFEFGDAQYLPQGLGVGAAEISFRHLFSKMPRLPGESDAAYLTRQERAFFQFIVSRNSPNASSYTPISERFPTPGASDDDPLSLLHRMRERRPTFAHGALPGLPVSPSGRASMGLDRLGNPLVWNYALLNATTATPFLDETTNDPYESRWLNRPYWDTPITIAEWERIYRFGDSDHGLLPKRLEQMFGEDYRTLATSSLRREITPLSRHLRLPHLAARSSLPNASGANSFMNLVNYIREFKKLSLIPEDGFRNLFPLEFHRGSPMNLNRPFGNGIDDNNDGQIDEPDEFVAGVNYSGQGSLHVSSTGVVGPAGIAEDYFESAIDPDYLPPSLAPSAGRLDFLNADPAIDYNSTTDSRFWGLETRQLYARHLYCLAQLIVPQDYVFPSVDKSYFLDLLWRRKDENPSLPTTYQPGTATRTLIDLRARILAQWAVNVVDFRDSDSVMTRFPYDPDPFHGPDFITPLYTWDPNNNFSFDVSKPTAPETENNVPYVAWGLEQPELLLTESLATHDTRVRRSESTNPVRYDQYRVPEGSLFLELYCPRTTAAPVDQFIPGTAATPTNPDRGLYTIDGSNQVALSLGKLAPPALMPNGNPVPNSRVPVWRVYITQPKELADSNAPNSPPQSPRERLMSGPWQSGQPTRNDLTYQFQTGNIRYKANNPEILMSALSGLVFDHESDKDKRLKQPDPSQSRVVVFTNGFSPANMNSPGVEDPQSQVFVNRSGNLTLKGGQYLVVGPRDTTYFGSQKAGRPATGDPVNIPNAHRIDLDSNWVTVFKADDTPITRRTTSIAQCVTMIAAAQSPWTSQDVNPLVGINVSEPLPVDKAANPSSTLPDYYDEPSARLNRQDDQTHDLVPGGSQVAGFKDLPYQDAYHDYSGGPRGDLLSPFDDDTAETPLANWDPDGDGQPNLVDTSQIQMIDQNQGGWVQPGTQLDWSTAYLQRLSDPDRPFHPTFNPYITVDWIPIDLTVFNGEDDDPQDDVYEPVTDLLFATRQKVGQTLNSRTLAFDTAAATATTGRSFLTTMTQEPRKGEDATNATADPFLSVQLHTDTPGNLPDRPTLADGSNGFSTFGFLNSGFVLAREKQAQGLNAILPNNSFLGAPAEPVSSGQTSNPNWHPDALFWANRSFVNSLELMWVPTSSPGQLGQEFSATITTNPDESPYASNYRNDDSTGLPADPRTPTAPVSPAFADTQAPIQPKDPRKWPNPNIALPVKGTPNSLTSNPTFAGYAAFTPYAYLLNFFQEVPELQPDPAYLFAQKQGNQGVYLIDQPSNPSVDATNDRFPKNTSLMTLFDLLETPSPWIDAYRTESPANMSWQAHNGDPVLASENLVFAPFRSPYNQIPEYVEPGRINLNTVSEKNVIHGLGANLLPPTDVPGIIDHNGNNNLDQGERTQIVANGAVATIAASVEQSRRGFWGNSISGFYNPAPGTDFFNPHFPTRFAAPFRPASEAGMVPKTRNPIANPTTPEETRLQYLADNKGVLDVYARQNAAAVTLLRGLDVAPSANAAAGIMRLGSRPLFFALDAQRNPMKDFYPIMRLKNLTTERSNVFAVYATIALFEYDTASGQIGIEYGADRGEQQRYKAFYVVDRSKPVGYQVGVDHNVEKTILARRYLNTEE